MRWRPTPGSSLVEAPTAADLYTAVDVASRLVAQAGGGEVSMSWGSSEFDGETEYDTHFKTPGVVYFAAAGDDPGTLYPASSAYVVAVGGTTIARDPATGDFLGEATWSDGGGGPSAFIPAPRYQNAVRYLTGAMRATPDISADANPYSGVYIYSFIVNGPGQHGLGRLRRNVGFDTDRGRHRQRDRYVQAVEFRRTDQPLRGRGCGWVPADRARHLRSWRHLRSNRDLESLRRTGKPAAPAPLLNAALPVDNVRRRFGICRR